MHKLDIAVGLLYLPVCFVIGYTTANLKLCQMLCTPPPPRKSKRWGSVGKLRHVWVRMCNCIFKP